LTPARRWSDGDGRRRRAVHEWNCGPGVGSAEPHSPDLPAAPLDKVLVAPAPWQTLAVGTPFEVVGRRAELAKLTGFIEGPERPTVVAIVGAAGMGKTTLWTAGVCAAHDIGWTVLSARPSGAEASFSFAGLSDLFAAVDEEVLARIPAVQRKALEVALLRSERDDRPADARAVSAGVLSLLQEMAVGAPVLVAVDDVTWLDRATASALGFALRRLEGSRTMLLATIREDEIRTNPVTGVAAAGQRVELLLRPLAAGTLRRTLDLRFGDEMSHNTTAKVVTACGGNPLFAVEIAQALLRQGQRPGAGPLPVPGELRQLLTSRVNRIPARARDALLVASCLASPHTGLVDASAIRPAEDAGLVTIEIDGRVRFTHPLLAAAVYESAPPSRRRSVHRMLAGRLEDLEERARHLALGSEGPDLEIAGHLDEAAKLAQAPGVSGRGGRADGAGAANDPTSRGSRPGRTDADRGRPPLRDRRSEPGARAGRTGVVGGSRQLPSRLWATAVGATAEPTWYLRRSGPGCI
jgi:hypothetical protein